MIRRFEKPYRNKLHEGFHTKDEWRDLRLPDINHRIGKMTKDELKVLFIVYVRGFSEMLRVLERFLIRVEHFSIEKLDFA